MATPPSENARCTSCKKPLVPGSEFCTHCGQRVPTQPDPIAKTAPGEPVVQAFELPSEAKPTPSTLASGTVIDKKYAIVRVLGEGGMGVVYLANEQNTGIQVVLKAIRPELTHRADIRERTLSEGRALARIDHPNVVQLKAVVTDETGLFLVMQYIEGESLDKTVSRLKADGKTLPLPQALAVFRQVLRGVSAAHDEGVIHRDLKPANILVRRKDGVAKVTDFGIAKPVEQAKIGEGKTKGVIGSLWYLSPEQVQGQRDLDKRVDIYALGIVLFELVTGEVPFQGASSYEVMRKHVDEPIPSVRDRPGLANVPAAIDAMIQKACAKNRDDRYPSAEAFLEALDEAERPVAASARGADARGATPAVTPRTETEMVAHVPDPAPPAAEHRSLPWAAIAAGISIFLFGVFVAIRGGIDAGPNHPTVTASASGQAPNPSPPESAQSAASAASSEDPLSPLEGPWQSEAGNQFSAIRVGQTVEFRITDPKQFAGANYAEGEARFILRPGDRPGEYLVEENMRPVSTHRFDPKSRATCQEIWTLVLGHPLGASLVDGELRVDFAKVHFADENFVLESGTVVSCKRLSGSPRGRGRTTLKRP